MLQEVGLAGLDDRRPARLSGGQPRVVVAQARAFRPAVVLADEPEANLDSGNAEGLIALMADLNRRSGVTLLIATHDARLLGQRLDLADRPPDLVDRLARGQLFTLRRDYLTRGVTPLLTASPTLITGLDDGSVLLLASACTLTDNLVLTGAVQIAVGGSGTEYGGVRAPTRRYCEAPSRIYLQLRRYF